MVWQHRIGVACVSSYMRERGEARRMGVAVAVAWQRRVGAACVPSLHEAVAVVWQHRVDAACVPSYRRAQQKCAAHFSSGEARPDEWASQ